MSNSSFYKKSLPPSCIAFHSEKGKEIFLHALKDKFMECYFPLSLQIVTQSEPAFCGLASLCMVLNSLEVDPLRQWRGVWRWYTEELLDCCRPLDLVKVDGITLAEFSCLAKCNGLQSTINLAEMRSKEDFLADLIGACSSSDTVMVISFSRKTLGQTGDGHFSPIGGYCKERNLVLVLDVARFKYPTYWVEFDLLWDSLLPIDSATKRSRGWTVLKRNPKIIHAYSQLNCDSETWMDLHGLIFHLLPGKLKELSETASILEYTCTFMEGIPEEYDSVVENRTLMFTNTSAEGGMVDESLSNYLNGLSSLLEKVAQFDLYKYLSIVKRKRRGPAVCVLKHDHLDRKPHSVRESPIDDTSFPSSPRRSQIQRLMSLSAVSSGRSSSLTDLLPVKEDLDYPTAFLTLFAIALLQFKPDLFYLNLKNTELSKKLEGMISNISADVCEEIRLIIHQIDALNEYIRK